MSYITECVNDFEQVWAKVSDPWVVVTSLAANGGQGTMVFMGTYDSVHTGSRCGQTKALGKGLGNLTPGATVRTYPAAMNEADFELELAGLTAAGPGSFQVLMTEGGYLTVRNNVLLEWADDRDHTLALFSNLGHPLTDPVPEGESEGVADYRAEMERQAVAGAESAQETTLAQALGVPTLADFAEGTPEHSQHQDAVRQRARDALSRLAGLPVDCVICADLNHT